MEGGRERGREGDGEGVGGTEGGRETERGRGRDGGREGDREEEGEGGEGDIFLYRAATLQTCTAPDGSCNEILHVPVSDVPLHVPLSDEVVEAHGPPLGRQTGELV